LQNIHIVLVEPQTPGNIGATARAMKTMGLTRLVLVNPVPFREVPEARWLACHSEEVLDGAQVVATLEEALAEVHFVVGTTHRKRGRRMPTPVNAREAATQIVRQAQEHTVALVFGRETTGLHTEELLQCHLCASIPAAARSPSLNLSHAVMVFAYEIFLASLTAPPGPHLDLAEVAEMEHLYAHFRRMLERLEFDPVRGGLEGFLASLRRVFGRTLLERQDVATLHDLCSAVERYLDRLAGSGK